jgi:hypothetical protein
VLGAPTLVRKSWACFVEVDDAAAATTWRMSLASLVLGSMRRSFANVVAMPPGPMCGVSTELELVKGTWCT